MALLDTHVRRTFATGYRRLLPCSGFAVRYQDAKVKTVRDEVGIVVDYITEGDFPRYGNDDDRADDIADMAAGHLPGQDQEAPHLPRFRAHHLDPAITSNVVYGRGKSDTMPDGRKA